MSIPNTEIKTLWGRAAGLCSMPDCRKQLASETEKLATGAVIIGENCHIISGAENGPRSEHPIDPADVDRYPNLILLCSVHHKIIDTDVETWTLEKVRLTKIQHEAWVNSSINRYKYASDQVYINLTEHAVNLLMFKRWSWVTDNAVRMLANEEWLNGMLQFRIEVKRALLPNKLPEFEVLAENLANRASQYAEHFMSMAWLPEIDSDFYIEDKTWKATRHPHEVYERYAARSDAWAEKCHLLLMNLTHAVNEFSDCVRTFIDPKFFINKGRFTVSDHQGVLNNLIGSEIFVRQYEDV